MLEKAQQIARYGCGKETIPFIDINEHNLDVIKTAGWLIDPGPEGGRIIATGTPGQVAKNPASVSGKYLAPLLEKKQRTQQEG